MSAHSSERIPLRRYVHWPILLPCVLLAVAGVAVELTSIATETKHFIAGILIGAGAGGAIAELAATLERRDSQEQLTELRETGLAECRRAYRMGEFFFGFQVALSRNDRDHREVREFLALAEILGLGPTLNQIVAEAPENIEYEELRNRIANALIFVSGSLPAFFSLGINVLAVRAFHGGDEEREQLRITLGKVSDGLVEAARYSEDKYLVSAWQKMRLWWESGKLSDADAQAFVLLFHAYLLLLGGRGSEIGQAFGVRKRQVERVSRMADRTKEPAIAQVAGELRELNS